MKLSVHKNSQWIIPALCLAGMAAYAILLIRPAIYAHHQQVAFLFVADFIRPFLSFAGGPAELLAGLFMQFFYRPFPGILVLMLFLALQSLIYYRLFGRMHKGPLTPVFSVLPSLLALILLNNYNFPFSVHISMLLLSAFTLLFYSRSGSLQGIIISFLGGMAALYYLSGPAFAILFALLSAGLLLKINGKRRWIMAVLIPVAGILIWLGTDEPFRFYTAQVYFKDYVPPLSFYLYLILPALLLPLSRLGAGLQENSLLLLAASILIPVVLAIPVHKDCYIPDASRVAASDYYSYHSKADRVARAATSLDEYNLAANLNYNLVMGKTGQLSARFFDFFQIRGSSSLQPDMEFASELAFISADYYYQLGFISEARHWAYEALVFYPHSPRALELLTKIHLILGEYPAARRCLNILDKGIVKRHVIRDLDPLLHDTTLITSHPEFQLKRNSIPVQKELNPHMDERFRELLESNPRNKLALESLLLYTMLEGKLDAFHWLWHSLGKKELPLSPVFEEALLIYHLQQENPSAKEPAVSQATREAYSLFSSVLKQYEGDKTKARNKLYWEQGTSYYFYLQFLYPRIIKPQLFLQEYDEAPI